MRRVRTCRAVLSVVILGALVVALEPSALASADAGVAGAHASLSPSAPQLVQWVGRFESAGAKSLTATFPTSTVGGHLLVLSASVNTATTKRITAVTDSAANPWIRIGAYAVSGHNSDGEMWYSANARAATSVTVHTASAAIVAFTAQEFAGVATTNPLDVTTGTANRSKTPSSGSATPSASSDLVVGFLAGHANAQPMTVTAPGYTAQPQQTSGASNVASVVVASAVATLTSAQNLTGSFAAKMYWAAGIAMFKPATNDFSIGASPGALTVTAGQPATTTISTTTTSGSAQSVALSASGLPAGASASFNPATITSGQTSTLTVATSVSTPAGTSTVTVTGTGASATQTTFVSIIVNAPAGIRAAFYYPWFPEAWTQQGQSPFTNYSPTRGLYSTDVATVKAQIADMQYANVTVGIASWFGQGTTTDKHFPALMQAAQGTGFGWAPYYEPEGISDPTPQQIANDLHYLWTTYNGANSGLVSLTGKGMVVFVYNADDPTQAKGCDTVSRWNQARQLLHDQFNESVYIDLKVFPGYASCVGTSSIDGWHQYGPASAIQNFATAPGDGSYSISPGYWKSGATYGTAPFLARDRAGWQASIATMRASGSKWQLITTYNEWGEGTAVESSSGCRNAAPAGTYCDWSAGGTVSDFVTDLHNAPSS
jgi:hypothetical protein